MRPTFRYSETQVRCSIHALAREARFFLLIFGFEALGNSRLDSYCEHAIREALYAVAFFLAFRTPAVSLDLHSGSTTNFLTAERWSHGSNRLQMDADSKLLTEFLSLLQADTARLAHEVSSLGHAQAASMNPSQ